MVLITLWVFITIIAQGIFNLIHFNILSIQCVKFGLPFAKHRVTPFRHLIATGWKPYDDDPNPTIQPALAEQTLAQLACDLPGATAIFHQYRLDFCCGGQKTLAAAAEQKQIDLTTLLSELAALTDDSGDDVDWREQSASTLIDHILSRFHQRHRQQLPELIRLARRVEQVHGDRPSAPMDWPTTSAGCIRNWKAT